MDKYTRHMPAAVAATIASDPESEYSTATYRMVRLAFHREGVVKVTFFDPPGTKRRFLQDPEYWYLGHVIVFDKHHSSVNGSWVSGSLNATRLADLIRLIDSRIR